MSSDTRIWHHAILTVYGAWLHGDARGFRTRHHREHVEGDYRNPLDPGEYAARERRSRESLIQTPVILPPGFRPVVGESLREKLLRLKAWVLRMSVSGQHVHLLVKMPPQSGRVLLGMAKKHTTFILREHGWQGKLWGVRCKSDRIRDRQHQVDAYHYILRHAEQGAWTAIWKTDESMGPS